MNLWHRFLGRLGALRATRVTWGLVLLFSIWVLLDVFVFKLTGGLSKSSFDAMVRNRVFVAAPDPRIVIIDIDEASLARMGKEFGRWPWPRDTLAAVLAEVERQQPAAVVWDIHFSDVARLSPGGDAAFDEAVKQSQHSHFSVVRLPKANDAASEITRAALPGLWASPKGIHTAVAAPAATVALIPPALPAVANGRLGFNNGYVDSDGMLRRYRYFERLDDGSAIQSLPMSVLSAVDAAAYQQRLALSGSALKHHDELISWRRGVDAYPHVSFADVFAQADGGKPLGAVPSFAGKVVILGSTAPSLHDIHPTPLSPMQAGVDSLATALDNALNQRYMAELPLWAQAALAIALCVGLALWAQFKSMSSLEPALLVLPFALIFVSYLSLNGAPVFLDLHLAAALALLFLALLRRWNSLRRKHWCAVPEHMEEPFSIWAWERRDAWREDALDRLISAVERHAPTCRVVVCDVPSSSLRWPELARFAAIVGPTAAMVSACGPLEKSLQYLADHGAEPVHIDGLKDREALVAEVLKAWSALHSVAAQQHERQADTLISAKN